MAKSIADAKAALEQAQKELNEALSAERTNAVANAKALVKEFDIKASELGFKTRRPKAQSKSANKPAGTVPQKYVNPEDKTQTWSGRGRKPAWVQNLLQKGGQLELLGAKS